MRFPFIPVTDFEDSTQNFEALQAGDILDFGSTSFLQLLAAQKLRLAYGTAQKTAAANASMPIPHGLGTAPAFAGGFPLGWAGYLYNQAPDATNINLCPSMALTANFFYWFAIG